MPSVLVAVWWADRRPITTTTSICNQAVSKAIFQASCWEAEAKAKGTSLHPTLGKGQGKGPIIALPFQCLSLTGQYPSKDHIIWAFEVSKATREALWEALADAKIVASHDPHRSKSHVEKAREPPAFIKLRLHLLHSQENAGEEKTWHAFVLYWLYWVDSGQSHPSEPRICFEHHSPTIDAEPRNPIISAQCHPDNSLRL